MPQVGDEGEVALLVAASASLRLNSLHEWEAFKRSKRRVPHIASELTLRTQNPPALVEAQMPVDGGMPRVVQRGTLARQHCALKKTKGPGLRLIYGSIL